MSAESQSSLKQDARSAVPYAVLSGGLQILLSLVGMLLLVRYLPPETYGKWVLMLGFAVPVILIASMGYRTSLLRFLPTLDEKAERAAFLWSVLFRRGGMALLVCIVLGLTFPTYSGWIGISGQWSVFLFLLPGFVFMETCHYLVIGLNSSFRQREVFLGSFLFQSVTVASVVVGIQLELELLYFAAVYSASGLVHLAFNFLAASYHIGPPRLEYLRSRHVEAAEERRYRRASFVDDLGNGLLSSDVNRFILAGFSSSAQVAIFAVASNMVSRLSSLLPLFLFRPLITVVFFRRYEESESRAELNRMFSFVFTLNRLLTNAALIVFLPLGYQLLVWAFRADYGNAYVPILVLLFSKGFLFMPVGVVAQVVRKPEWLVYSKFAVLVNFGLGIPMSMKYGATGMAVVAALSELVKGLIVFVLLKKNFQLRYPWASSFRFLLAGAAVAAVIAWLNTFVPLLVAAAMGAVGWLVAIRFCGVLTKDERGLLAGITPDRFQPLLRIFVKP